jgi:hypothetical protein
LVIHTFSPFVILGLLNLTQSPAKDFFPTPAKDEKRRREGRHAMPFSLFVTLTLNTQAFTK